MFQIKLKIAGLTYFLGSEQPEGRTSFTTTNTRAEAASFETREEAEGAVLERKIDNIAQIVEVEAG